MDLIDEVSRLTSEVKVKCELQDLNRKNLVRLCKATSWGLFGLFRTPQVAMAELHYNPMTSLYCSVSEFVHGLCHDDLFDLYLQSIEYDRNRGIVDVIDETNRANYAFADLTEAVRELGVSEVTQQIVANVQLQCAVVRMIIIRSKRIRIYCLENNISLHNYFGDDAERTRDFLSRIEDYQESSYPSD